MSDAPGYEPPPLDHQTANVAAFRHGKYVHAAVVREGLWSPACEPEVVGWKVPLARDQNQVTCAACQAYAADAIKCPRSELN